MKRCRDRRGAGGRSQGRAHSRVCGVRGHRQGFGPEVWQRSSFACVQGAGPGQIPCDDREAAWHIWVQATAPYEHPARDSILNARQGSPEESRRTC